MSFKFIGVTIASLTFLSCGAPLVEPDIDSDLPAMTFFSQASGSGMQVDPAHVAFVDNRVDFLLRFQLDPFKFVEGIPLTLGVNEAQWFLPASKGRYYITIGNEDFAIINNRGLQEKNPVRFDNDIQAAALSANHDYLFLQDELGKIFILDLSESGELENRFLGSSTLGTDEAFVAGAMLSDGRFIASLGESTIALINLKNTLNDQEWSIETFDVSGATAMTWLSKVPNESEQVLIKDSNRILLVDHGTGSVLDEVDLSGKQDVRASRQGHPHILAADNITNDEDASQPYQLYYAKDGGIAAHVISNIKANFSSSYLDSDKATLVVAVNELNERETTDKEKVDSRFKGDVFRFDIRNGVGIDKTELNGSTRVALTNRFVVQHFDSALGLVKRVKYGNSDKAKALELFNLELLRDKHE